MVQKEQKVREFVEANNLKSYSQTLLPIRNSKAFGCSRTLFWENKVPTILLAKAPAEERLCQVDEACRML